MPYTCCTGPYISLMHHPGGGQDFSSLEGGLLWGPPCSLHNSPPSPFPTRAAPAGSPSNPSQPQGCSRSLWGPPCASLRLPPPPQPKIAALQQVLWFLMALFSRGRRGGHLPLPSTLIIFFSMPLFPGGALVAPHPSLLPGGWLRPLNVGWGRPGPGFRMKGGAIGAARSGLGPCQAAEPSFYGGDSAELSPGSRPVGRAGTPLLSPRRLQAALLGAGGAAPLQSPPPFCPGICGDGGGGDAGGGHKGVPNTWVVAQRSLPRGGGDSGVPRGGSMG